MTQTLTEDVFDRAFDFVDTNGSPWTKALAANAIGRMSSADAVERLVAFQNSDGGWQSLDSNMKGTLSTISQIWVGLKWLHWLRPDDTSPVDCTVDFLRWSQHSAGYWDEPQEILEHDRRVDGTGKPRQPGVAHRRRMLQAYAARQGDGGPVRGGPGLRAPGGMESGSRSTTILTGCR